MLQKCNSNNNSFCTHCQKTSQCNNCRGTNVGRSQQIEAFNSGNCSHQSAQHLISVKIYNISVNLKSVFTSAKKNSAIMHYVLHTLSHKNISALCFRYGELFTWAFCMHLAIEDTRVVCHHILIARRTNSEGV